MSKERAQEIFQLLKKHYPKAKMILEWTNNFELLVSIILSAQCADKKVNEVTAVVFPKYKKERPEFESQYNKFLRMVIPIQQASQDKSSRPSSSNNVIVNGMKHSDSGQARMTKEEGVELVNFANVPLQELEQDIKSTGFYHNKAKSVQEAAKVVLEKFHGILPRSIEELITIPGVGRKTANVFLGNAYNIHEGIAVDTHVIKQSQALGLSTNTTSEKIEQDLMNLFPKEQWFPLTYLLIEHGRNLRRKVSDRVTCGDKECGLCYSN
jgi:endonuclease III